MFWRKFKLDWSYAIGELIIVTVGVLIALGVNQWQHDREDRVLELQYADRLKADLQKDINQFKNFEADALSAKTRVLKALSKLDSNQTAFDHSVFNAENFNYSVFNALPSAQTTSFNELLSTGKLSLLRNPATRMAIGGYYDTHELMSGILFESPGDYSEIFAGAMSGTAIFDWRVNDIDLSETDVDEGLQKMLSHPDFRAAVNSELNYTSELMFYLREIRIQGEALLTILEAEYP